MQRLRALATEAGLDPVFAEKFLAFIVTEVIRHHEEIAEGVTTPDEGAHSTSPSAPPAEARQTV